MDEVAYKDVGGVLVPKFFRDDCVRSAITYKPRDGDIIVVTYPKCGTNWTMVIVWNILTREKSSFDIGEFGLMCPYLEMTGAQPAERPERIGPIMTHLPLSVFRPVDNAKYIYMARNPYDVAVSYYCFLKGFVPKTVTDFSFERFLPLYLNGKVGYGDYFDHLLPWYERRNDTNILFITYEELKSDTKTLVLRIAAFMGEQHGTSLLEDPCLLEKVVHASSLDSMKTLFTEKPGERRKKMAALALEKSLPFEALSEMPKKNVETHESGGLIRKGIVGDWRNYFTSNQILQMKAWIAKKTEGSDVMALWKDCDLP